MRPSSPEASLFVIKIYVGGAVEVTSVGFSGDCNPRS